MIGQKFTYNELVDQNIILKHYSIFSPKIILLELVLGLELRDQSHITLSRSIMGGG